MYELTMGLVVKRLEWSGTYFFFNNQEVHFGRDELGTNALLQINLCSWTKKVFLYHQGRAHENYRECSTQV